MKISENSIYVLNKRYLDEAIASIPKFKIWIGISKEMLRAEEARRAAEAQQRQGADLTKQLDQVRRNEEQRQSAEASTVPPIGASSMTVEPVATAALAASPPHVEAASRQSIETPPATIQNKTHEAPQTKEVGYLSRFGNSIGEIFSKLGKE